VSRFFMGFVFASFVLGLAASATAQTPHPRRATSMAFDRNRPAVLLADDVAWQADHVAISVCTATRCAAVVEREHCEAPECPGPGYRMVLDESIGDVSGWPTSLSGFNEEIESLRADPHFTDLGGLYGYHPENDDDGDDEEGVFFHFGVLGTAGSVGTGGGALIGVSGSMGLALFARGEELYDNEKFWETFFFGDRIRLMTRGSYVTGLPEQGPGYIGMVGGVLEFENRVEGTAWAVPTLLSILLPELGATFRESASPGFYAQWSLPVRLHLSKRAGIEIRMSASAIERVDDQGVEGLFTLSVGGFIR